MADRILRCHPRKKEFRSPIHKHRYTDDDFEKYEKIASGPGYKKWKSGINWVTGRKIKIGGKLHSQLGRERYYYDMEKFFRDIDGSDRDSYNRETEIIRDKERELNADIEKHNAEVKKYNKDVDDVISKIDALEKWSDCVTFEGVEYGIPEVYKNIHRKDDCFGIMQSRHESCRCNSCENWFGCTYPRSTTYYRCEECDYQFSVDYEGYQSKSHPKGGY